MSTITITLRDNATAGLHIQAAPGAEPGSVLERAIIALEAERAALNGCPAHTSTRSAPAGEAVRVALERHQIVMRQARRLIDDGQFLGGRDLLAKLDLTGHPLHEGDGNVGAEVERFVAELAALATPAPAADGLREAAERRYLISGISLPVARALVELFGGEDSDMTVEFIVDGHSGSGFYAWCTEYPEDGSEFLGPHFDVSEISALAQPAESASGETVALLGLIDEIKTSVVEAHRDQRLAKITLNTVAHKLNALRRDAASTLEALQREKEALARKVDELIDNSMGLLGNEMRAIEAAQRAETALASAEKRAEEAAEDERDRLLDRARNEHGISAMWVVEEGAMMPADRAAARAARGGQG